MVNFNFFFFFVLWFALVLAESLEDSSVEINPYTKAWASNLTQFRFDYKYYDVPNPQTKGWFKLHTFPADWHTARMQCYAEGATLVSPINQNFLNIIKSLQYEQKTLHSGVHATFSNGVFTSVEGLPMHNLVIEWGSNEQNFNETKQCMAYFTDGIRFSDCGDLLPYICYRNNTGDEELTECGTVDKAYTLDARTNHCYKFHSRAQTWDHAMKICHAEGGYLAVINSEEEAGLLRDLWVTSPIYATYTSSIFVGYRRWGLDGHLWTIHGQTLEDAGYAKWSIGEPSGTPGAKTKQSCGTMYKSGKLDDAWCEYSLGFICEKTTDSLLAVLSPF